MADDEQPDVREPRHLFVSTRTVGLRVLSQLHEYLGRSGLTYYSWKDTGDDVEIRHSDATNSMIAMTQGAIILMSDAYFRKVPGAKVCAQEEEVRKIMALAKRPGYKVLIVILQDKSGYPSQEEFDAGLLDHCKKFNFDDMHRDVVPNALEPPYHPDWDDALSRIAANMAKWLGNEQARQARLQAKARPSELETNGDKNKASPPRWDSARFAEQERKYIDAALDAWRAGRGSDAPEKADRSEAARFDPRRFIVLNARETGSENSALAGDVAAPVTNWLFMPTPHPPFAIRGAAGAGHTCTLAMTAAALAARHDNELMRRCAEIPPVVLEAAREFSGKSAPVPVFLRARRIAELTREGKLTMRDVLFAAVAGRLTGNAKDAPSIEAMRERMLERPYAVLVDELDRISADDEADVLRVLGDTQAFFDTQKRPIKLLAAGQPVARERIDSIAEIILERPTTKQRQDFFEAYAKHQRPSAALALSTIQEAAARLQLRTQSTTGSASSETFDTPLLLNAFCWGALAPDARIDECNGQVALCQRLAELILKRVTENHPGVISKDQASEILENIAVANLKGDVDEVAAGKIAAAVMGGPASKALTYLVEKTNLLAREEFGRKRSFYSLRGLFRHYFAAEHLSGRDDLVQLLQDLSGQHAERHWRDALAFACSLFWLDGRESRALETIDCLLARAKSATEPSDQAGWFLCLATCLAALAPIVESDAPPQQAAIDEATAFFAQSSAGWTPKQRAAIIAELSAAVRRNTERETRKAVNKLYRGVLRLKQDWIEIPGFVHPSGDRTFRVAGMPLLVAHYGEYIAHRRGRASVATETSALQNSAADGRAVDEAGIDVWESLSVAPGAPMVSLTFYEAVDYCKWLTQMLRLIKPGPLSREEPLAKDEWIRLPTFIEWRAMSDSVRAGSVYLWGDEAPGQGDASRINWRGANIGAATPPGAFPPYGAPDLYDFGSNVAVWTIPDRPAGQSIWPDDFKLAPGENPPAIGVHFASKTNALSGFGDITTLPPTQRRRERGVRLVRTRCVSGWGSGA